MPVWIAQSLSRDGVDSVFTDEQDRESSAFYEIKGNSINISNVISLGWAISPTQSYEPTRSVVIHALMKAAYLMNAILLLILYISWFLSCSPFCKNPTSLMSTPHFHKQWPSLWCYSMMIRCSRFCSQGYSHCFIQSALRCLSQIRAQSCFSNQGEQQVHSLGRFNALQSDTRGRPDEMVKNWEITVCHYWLHLLPKNPHQHILVEMSILHFILQNLFIKSNMEMELSWKL